jgi:hypothetical protein
MVVRKLKGLEKRRTDLKGILGVVVYYYWYSGRHALFDCRSNLGLVVCQSARLLLSLFFGEGARVLLVAVGGLLGWEIGWADTLS